MKTDCEYLQELEKRFRNMNSADYKTVMKALGFNPEIQYDTLQNAIDDKSK